jgi:hypothetical protein
LHPGLAYSYSKNEYDTLCPETVLDHSFPASKISLSGIEENENNLIGSEFIEVN